MAVAKVQIIGGSFQDSEGNLLANGQLKMTLNQDEAALNIGQVASGITVTVPLDGNGDAQGTQIGDTPVFIWPNDVLTPVNSFYRVSGYSASGQLAWGPNYQQVLSSPSPFNLDAWIPNTLTSWQPPLQPLVLQTDGVNNPNQQLENLRSGTNVVLVTDSAGTTINATSSGPTLGLAAPFCWTTGDGSFYPAVTTAAGQMGTGTANQVKFWMSRVPYSIAITKISTRGLGNLAGSKSAFAVYNATGTTKLFSWDNISTAAWTGTNPTTTLGATVTLSQAVYIFACACDTNGTAPTTLGGFAATGTNEGVEPWNTQGIVRAGTCSAAMSGGIMPANLGTFSPGGSGFVALPAIVMEP